jgi:hypothetical protein
MTLNELKSKYARLSNEIDTLAAEGGPNEARLMRLMGDLDQVHRELSELRLRTFAAPTLRDAVSRPGAAAARPVVVPMLAAVAPAMPSPAWLMAG